MNIPALVYRDIREAVDSAIQFGMPPEDFMRAVADHWDEALADKRRRDASTFDRGAAK